jgi:hypothetical protein
VAADSVSASASGVAFRSVGFDPDRPLEEQVAALGVAVEQLRGLLGDERQQRERAVAQAEQRGKAELAAEARRVDDAISGVQEQVSKLEEAVRETGSTPMCGMRSPRASSLVTACLVGKRLQVRGGRVQAVGDERGLGNRGSPRPVFPLGPRVSRGWGNRWLDLGTRSRLPCCC